MTQFVVVASIMTLFAVAVLLPALWRRSGAPVTDHRAANVSISQEQLVQLGTLHAAGELTDTEFEERAAELELELASSLSATAPAESDTTDNPAGTPTWASSGFIISLVVAVVLPVSAYYLYEQLGTPEALDPEFVAAQRARPEASGNTAASIEELLPRLQAHLDSNPDDLQGWRLLGVTYQRMQRYAEADSALDKALELAPNDPDILLQLADAKAMSAGGQLQGEPEALIRRALKLRPDDLRGLWLMGMTHAQNNEHEAALSLWESLLPRVQDEPDAARQLTELIADARAASGGVPATGGSTDSSDVAAATVDNADAASIAVKVKLDATLIEQLDPDLNVFIYAKAVSGPPMPLAVVRRKVSDLPLELTLDDSMAMVAGMNLSGFPQVIVGARVSLTGQPVASSGDYFAEVQPVDTAVLDVVTLSILDRVP